MLPSHRLALVLLLSSSSLAACSGNGAAGDDTPQPDAGDSGDDDSGDDSGDDGGTGIDAGNVEPPTSIADGVCERATMTSGVLDPDCVYLSRKFDDSYVLAVYDLGATNAFTYGTSALKHAAIRPTSGRVIYSRGTGTGTFAEIEPDPTSNNTYSVMSNDTLLLAPACPGSALYDFVVFPDDGKVLYACGGDASPWMLEGETAPLVSFGSDRGYVVAAGPGRIALASNWITSGPDALTIRSASGIVDVDGDYDKLVATRWGGDGFLVAVRRGTSTKRIDLDHITPSGEVVTVGTFGVASSTVGYPFECVLEASQALVCTEGLQVVRYTTNDSTREVLHQAAMLSDLSQSKLITGP